MTALIMTNPATKIPLTMMMTWVKVKKVRRNLTQTQNRKSKRKVTVHKMMMQVVTMGLKCSSKR